jgi:hypothetical protein
MWNKSFKIIVKEIQTETTRKMKKYFIHRGLLLCAASFFMIPSGFSQISEIGRLMAAGVHDAELLIQPYITPAVNAFGAGLGSGWYNTAETHKLGGFDITFTTNAAIVPEKYETFLIDDSQLTSLKLHDPLMNESPTVAGENEEGPLMDYDYTGYSVSAFEMPAGLNTNYVPSPMVQAGIGLIKGTEVMIRFMPDIKYSGNEIGLWGIGGKHDIKQWIPALKKFPVLQISVMYGYTNLHTLVDIDITPADINAGSLPGADDSNWDNQFMKSSTQTHTANLLVGATLPVVSFYGGVGFVSSQTNLKLEGDFPAVTIDGVNPEVQVLTDPIDMEIKNQDGSITKPRFNAGLRLKFAFITLHFDYSWANYSVLSGGLGITFR